MEIGEQLWWKVELSAECLLGHGAVEVMFNGVLGRVAASKEAAIRTRAPLLESSVCAPAVP